MFKNILNGVEGETSMSGDRVKYCISDYINEKKKFYVLKWEDKIDLFMFLFTEDVNNAFVKKFYKDYVKLMKNTVLRLESMADILGVICRKSGDGKLCSKCKVSECGQHKKKKLVKVKNVKIDSSYSYVSGETQFCGIGKKEIENAAVIRRILNGRMKKEDLCEGKIKKYLLENFTDKKKKIYAYEYASRGKKEMFISYKNMKELELMKAFKVKDGIKKIIKEKK